MLMDNRQSNPPARLWVTASGLWRSSSQQEAHSVHCHSFGWGTKIADCYGIGARLLRCSLITPSLTQKRLSLRQNCRGQVACALLDPRRLCGSKMLLAD